MASSRIPSAQQQTSSTQDELHNRILRFLHLKSVSGLEDIHASVDSGVVTLSGRVSTARMKSLCVAYCQHVAGVLRVLDELKMQDEPMIDPQSAFE